MLYMATHLVDVIDEDETGVQSTAAAAVPMSILQGRTGSIQNGGGASDGGKDIPWTARCPTGTPVTDGMLLRSGSSTWLVDLVDQNPNPVMHPGMILTCRAVTA